MNYIYIQRNELCVIDENMYNDCVAVWAVSHGYDRIYLRDHEKISGILIANQYFIKEEPFILREYKYLTEEQYHIGNKEAWFQDTRQKYLPVILEDEVIGEVQLVEACGAVPELYWELIDDTVFNRFVNVLDAKITFAVLDDNVMPLYKRLKKEACLTVDCISDLKDAILHGREKSTIIYYGGRQRKNFIQRDEHTFITVEYIYCFLILETLLEFYKRNQIKYCYAKIDRKENLPLYIREAMYSGRFIDFAKDQEAISSYYGSDKEDSNHIFWKSGDFMRFSVIKKDIGSCLRDCQSRTYNVLDGKRYTPGNPNKYAYTVHCHGNCIVRGAGVADEHTIPSYLQKEYIEKSNQSVRVVNYGLLNSEGIYYLNNLCMDCYRKRDIVVHIDADVGLDPIIKKLMDRYEIHYIQLKEAFNEDNTKQPLFIDIFSHCNHKANEIIAKFLYERIPCEESNEEEAAEEVCLRKKSSRKSRTKEQQDLLEEYKRKLESLRNPRYKELISGGIVMNCNPCTLGHLYVIEESRKRVDWLYVFVVEEDKSYFSFVDRYAMVKANCEKYENVTVIPSGQFILSALTFPEYFFKEEQKDAHIDPSQDIDIFGREVSPVLNITYRFVGEEPLDPVTEQYNKYLMERLPEYGIQLIVIPRKRVNGTIVSATLVRQLLKMGKLEEIREYVPLKTYEYIKKRYSKRKE